MNCAHSHSSHRFFTTPLQLCDPEVSINRHLNVLWRREIIYFKIRMNTSFRRMVPQSLCRQSKLSTQTVHVFIPKVPRSCEIIKPRCAPSTVFSYRCDSYRLRNLLRRRTSCCRLDNSVTPQQLVIELIEKCIYILPSLVKSNRLLISIKNILFGIHGRHL